MEITYDLTKNAKNISERDLPFSKAADFQWGTASFREDVRKDYPESRFVAVGYLDDRLHVLCFSETDLGIRVISFRKANKREEKDYEKDIGTNE
ncbi:BrnT family toxin [Polynucleobacter paneuropaeus]|nr:BrnT family toxin [Polynucleobacter paneuropaeus]